MEKLIMAGQFLFGLFIIVGIHEFGHLLFAKLFGMRVESYIIGFPPKIISFKWGDTEYALGAIPVGGAVKISGIIDESLDTAHLNKAPEPWEYRAKPAWKRLIVMLGGILFNIISGLIIYICLAFFVGDIDFSKDEVNQYGIIPNELGRTIGFEEGDRIIEVNGKKFDNFFTSILSPSELLVKGGCYTIIRNGQALKVPIPSDIITQLSDQKGQEKYFVQPLIPFQVGLLQPGGAAEKAGLQVGDKIIVAAGKPIIYWHQFFKVLQEKFNQTVPITYSRDGVMHNAFLCVNGTGKIGFEVDLMLKPKHLSYGCAEAISVGVHKAVDLVKSNMMAIGKIFSGKISPGKALNGPIGIAQLFGGQFNWVQFWSIVGMLSMVVAFTNLLPIPALDGGHAVLILYEMITGRTLLPKLVENVQKIGIMIVLSLTIYAVLNDLYKLF